MKKLLLILFAIAASIGQANAQCFPQYNTATGYGTGGGDFIESVYSGAWGNIGSGFTGGPTYTNYAGIVAPLGITAGLSYNLNVTGGSYPSDVYAAWIDFNADGDFYDVGEKLGEFSTSATYQTLLFAFSVPAGAIGGYTTMRVRCVYSGVNMDPCSLYDYGEAEDYEVFITNTGNYCLPQYTNGTSGNDYLNSVSMGSINNVTGANTVAPYYSDYTFLSTNLTIGSFYTLSFQTGSYVGAEGIAAWIDYNQDGILSSTEKLGEDYTTTSFENGSISFVVPAGALAGFTLLRVRLVYNGSTIDPCATYTYGETEDYAVNLVSQSGGYCTTNLNPSCGTGYITGVQVLGTTLNNQNNGCIGSPEAYFNYPATGNYTANIVRGNNYTINVTTNSNDIISVWIDLNQDQVFASNEWAQVTTSSTAFATSSVIVTIPAGAALGQTRMRVRSRAFANPNAAADACTLFGSGETEDYTITIVNASGLPPVADFTAAQGGGGGVDFFDASQNNPTSWFWQFPGGVPSTSTLQNPTGITWANGGCYDVSLTVTNAFGSDTYTYVCFVSVLQPVGCSEPFISEYLEGSANNKAIEIYNPSGTTLNLSQYAVHNYANGATTPTYTLQLSGTLAPYSVYVVADPSSNSAILAQADVTSNVCFFDGNDVITLKKNGQIIDMVGSVGIDPGVPFTVLGGSMGEATLVRNFSVDRPYTFWNTVLNDWTVYAQNTTSQLGGHTSVCTPAGLPPVANFTANLLNINVGQTVNFTDLSTNQPTSWSWTFTGGSPASSTAQNPNNIQYNTPGCYQVSLTSSNAFGSDVHTMVCYINVTATGAAPVAAFSASSLNITAGQTVNFTDLSTNAPTSWSWTFTGGSPASSTTQNPTNIQYNAVGCYQVSLTASNAFGSDNQTNTCYINVTAAGQAPVASFTASNTQVCAGACINFTDISLNNPTGWSWSFPGAVNTTSTQQNPTNVCYNNPGTYNVTLTALNANGSNSNTQTGYITVFANPQANAGNNVSICPGQSTNLTATGGTTYQWTPTTGLSNAGIANPVASPAVTTTYTVIASNGPCSSTASVTVTVAPVNANAGGDVTLCPGSTTTLNATGGTSYSWSPSTGLSSSTVANPIAFPTATTTYTVTVSNGSCSATDQITVTVANPQIFAPADQTICEGDTLYLPVVNGWNFTWTPATGLSDPTSPAPFAYPSNTTTYSVSADVNGCIATDQITITVNQPPPAPTITQNLGDLVSSTGSTYQWSFNGAEILGATFQTLFAATTGSYTVTITDVNGCSATSQPYVVTTVGLNSLSGNTGSVNIYPVPVKSTLTVYLPSVMSNPTIEIMNALGQKVQGWMIQNAAKTGEISINMSNVPDGVYFLKVTSAGNTEVKRFVKAD
jgi:PKD repeat protein